MSFELNKLKKELKNLDKEYKKYLNSAKTFENENKKIILSYISLMEKKIKNVKIEINTKEASIKISADAKKEKEAFKRKANNAFNSPVKNKKLAKK
jgi:archaellum component FlaC